MPVRRAVVKSVVPAMLAMLMALIYNLADTFFVGQTHDDFQVAAVSLPMPVFMLFLALGAVFGIGGTALISRALGEGRTGYVKKVSSFCMWGGVIVGVLISALLSIFIDDVLRLLGASENTWEFTKSYLLIISASGPFMITANCFSNILRAEGQVTKAMAGTVIGNLVNIVLDPIMILLLGWGITGAAIATVVGNVVGTVYYIAWFLRGKSMLSISPRDFAVRKKVAKSVFAIGVPAALGTALMSLSNMIMNGMIAEYDDMAVAAAGVAMRVIMIVGVIAIGIGQGIQPLLGYCVGAKNWERYKAIMKFSVLFSLILGAFLTIVCYIFTGGIVGAFLTQESAFDYAVRFFHILLSTAFFLGVYVCHVNALQAMGAAVSALVVNVSRQGLIYIPLLFALRHFLGELGIIWAQPIADVISLLLAGILHAAMYRRLSKATVLSIDSVQLEGEPRLFSSADKI